MALSHSFAGEHIEDGGDEKADAEGDHSDIEHDGSAPSNHQTRGSSPTPASGPASLYKGPARVKFRDGSLCYEIKNA
jgi:hypothetical protein